MKLLGVVIAMFAVVGATLLMIRFLTGSEDTWLCRDGQWVRHGNPIAPMPTSGCGEAVTKNENVGMANPASVNCAENGGTVEMKTDESGGQYGMCVFPDGKQCEEWAMFRGECPVGGEEPKETSVTKPQKGDLIVVSPLVVEGSMPGNWFFEANAVAVIMDANGKLLGTGSLTAKSDWMTTATIPFSGSIVFSEPETTTGTLVIKNDNPSGLPENDKTEVYPISFGSAVKVFFPNEKKTPGMPDCSQVFPVERIVLKTSAVARAALEELLKGPSETEAGEGYITTINSGVTIQSLVVEDGTVKVDFSRQLEEAVGGSCRVSAIRSQIENTLKQFSTVKNTAISIDGRTEDILQP